jgi:acyl-coenzyme A synthetase/AMP-(fatty) acid ligase
LQYQGANWSYGDFFKAVDQVCDWLLNEAQIQKGDPIAIAMRNRPEWLVSFVATVTIGAVAVPLNSWGKAQELTQGLGDSKAKLVFCDRDRLTFIRELNTELPAVVVDEARTRATPYSARSDSAPHRASRCSQR